MNEEYKKNNLRGVTKTTNNVCYLYLVLPYLHVFSNHLLFFFIFVDVKVFSTDEVYNGINSVMEYFLHWSQDVWRKRQNLKSHICHLQFLLPFLLLLCSFLIFAYVFLNFILLPLSKHLVRFFILSHFYVYFLLRMFYFLPFLFSFTCFRVTFSASFFSFFYSFILCFPSLFFKIFLLKISLLFFFYLLFFSLLHLFFLNFFPSLFPSILIPFSFQPLFFQFLQLSYPHCILYSSFLFYLFVMLIFISSFPIFLSFHVLFCFSSFLFQCLFLLLTPTNNLHL